MSIPEGPFTEEDAVAISYHDLQSSPLLLAHSIEKAFGSHPDSLGIIIVKDLPDDYVQYRKRLLKLAYRFASLDADACEKYVDVGSKYSFGWSHGKEIMNGKPDTLKGSYYANPVVDKPIVSREEQASFPEYHGENIWPSKDEVDVEGFEEAFKDLGRFIFDVGCELAVACQPFALSQLESGASLPLPDLIRTSQTTKARLLHYFPPSEIARENESVDSWCGFHLDHSLLTGLCSAMYLRKSEESTSDPVVVPAPSPKAGLYIRTRGGELKKVSIPVDCLAFQTGEALEIATGGKLLATPHCVRVVPGPDAADVSRETFALFMQPNTDEQLSPSMTFGQYSKKVFEEHYQETKI